MGGEPTFVSVDDRDGAEWNTEAHGPDQARLCARDLLKRLKAKLRAGGLLHFGQGKWYPGEQLPRWSLSCFWRKDGEPVLARPGAVRRRARTPRRYTQRRRRALPAHARARSSALDAKYVFPAYEDTWYYLWRERRLPANVDPFDSRLDDPLERARLRKHVPPGPGQRRSVTCCRSAQRTRHAGGRAGQRPLVPARRALLPDSRRFAAGLAPAARFAALGVEGDYPYRSADPFAPAVRCRRPRRFAAIRRAHWARVCRVHGSAQRRRRHEAPRPASSSRGARRHSATTPRLALAHASNPRAGYAHGLWSSRDLRRAKAEAEAAAAAAVHLHAAAASSSRTTSSCSPRSRPPPPNSA